MAVTITTVARGTKIAATETTLVRDVAKKIFLLQPEASPMLTFINGIGNKKVTNAAKFEWFEDDLLPNTIALTAADGTASTLHFADETEHLRVGDILITPSGESILVDTITDASHAAVTRSMGSVAADDLASGEELIIAGNALQEGSAYAASKATQKTPKSNYIQIFKDSVEITEVQDVVDNYGGNDRVYQRMKKAIEHKRGIEQAFLFGDGFELTTGTQTRRGTSGLLNYISTNTTDFSSTSGGVVTEADFEAALRSIFRYSSSMSSPSKTMLTNTIMTSAINFWAKNALVVSQDDKSFGMRIATYRSGHGDLKLVKHWLLADFTEFTKYCFIIDPSNIFYRYLPGLDTKLHLDTGLKSTSAYLDEYRTYCGLQVCQESTHGFLKGITGFAA